MVKAEQVRKFLSNPFVRWQLKKLSKRQESGKVFIDEMFAAYAGQGKVKLKYIPYFIFISLLPYILKADPKELKKIYSTPYYRKAISNVAKSVSEYGLSTPQIFSTPILVVWNFTNACNLNCKHCYQDAHHVLPDELSLEERLKVIDELDYNYISTLAFSGGEPLIHKDFWQVAKYAHDKGFHLSVATNGTLITKDVAARLKEVGINYVEISVDSVKPEVHDEFRGGKGYWQRTIEGIKNCVEVDGLQVGMATTLTRNNFSELEELIELAKDLNVDYFYVFNFIPVGRGKDIIKDDLTPEMREEMLRILHTALIENEHLGAFSTCPQYGRYCYQNAPEDVIINSHYGYAKGEHAKMLADYVGGCGVGRAYCAIQPNGVITPCVFLPIEVGNLREQRLADIWRNAEDLKGVRDRSTLKESCGSCDYRSMCGGCRARAYGYFGDYTAPDPGCIFNKAAWEKLTAQAEELELSAEV
ncbi:MAG TPA: radical SAM protein [Clostridiales bacterium]|nr:radical SAM protein [Clostridiales bacterium]